MSITFSITNSPREVVDTYECQCMEFDGIPWSKCPCCSGKGVVEYDEDVWPWVNLANSNAMNVLQAVGLAPEYGGVLEAETLDHAIQGCLRALNSESRRAVATREQSYTPGGHAGIRTIQDGNLVRVEHMGAAVHECGYSDDMVRHRVGQLLEICKKAKEEGEAVVWG